MIDENNGYVTLAFDGTDVQPLLVDPVTGRLLIKVTSDGGAYTNPSVKIDENNEDASFCVDDNGDEKPLITNSSGELLIDLTIE